MRVLGRILYFAFCAVSILVAATPLALIAYLFYVILTSVFGVGGFGVILIGMLHLGVLGAGLYFLHRRYRGKTEEERYEMEWGSFLDRLRDLRWPWSYYGLFPGQHDRTERQHEDPPAGTHRAG